MTSNQRNPRPFIYVKEERNDPAVARALLEGKPQPQGQQYTGKLPERFVEEKGIYVPQHNVWVAEKEILPNLTWQNAHLQVPNYYSQNRENVFNSNGKATVYITPIRVLMTHIFENVRNAALEIGKLVNAKGEQLTKAQASELWDYYTSTNRSKFNDKLCWGWLNEKFVEGTANGLNIEEYRVVRNGSNLELKPVNSSPLEARLEEDCYATLEFNRQGLATKKSSTQEYKQGENIKFWFPKKGYVAWFDAGSVRAGLFCGRDPVGSLASLGVSVCAEGAPKI